MDVLNKISSITSFYRDMNTSNFSGAIDVIVVENKETGILSATPFHIRFGKQHIIKVTDNNVMMFVNEQICPIGIKLSKNGDVYFESEDSDSEESSFCKNKKTALKSVKIWTMSEIKAISKRKNGLKLKKINFENYNTPNPSESDMKKDLVGSKDSNLTAKDSSFQETIISKNSTFPIINRYADVEMVYKIYNIDYSQNYGYLREEYEFMEETQIEPKKKKEKKKEEFFIKILCNNFTEDELLFLRHRYQSKRIFSLHQYYDFYQIQTEKFATFHSLLNSDDNYEFLLKSHKKLYILILGLIKPIHDPDANTRSPKKRLKRGRFSYDSILPCDINSGCKNSELLFSECSKQKIYRKEISVVFENFRKRNLENTTNVVTRITGCNKCRSEFYMYYDLFTDLFFYLRNLVFSENKSKKKKFLQYLEKKCTEKRGYSFFKQAKWKKTVSDNKKMTIELSHQQLKRMNLNPGKNNLMFKIDGTDQKILTNCFLWSDDSKIVVSDIDGTITKSDTLGHVYTIFGKDWTHSGVAELFTRIRQNDYKILYLSSRPIGQMKYTKKYLEGISQGGYEMPEGPVLVSPVGLFGALYREVILRRPEEFKIACLQTVKNLFLSPNSENKNHEQLENNPLFGGFGNRKTDVITYKAVGISTHRIYTINPTGKIVPEFSSSISNCYLSLNSIADSVFPPFNCASGSNIDLCAKWWNNV